MTQLFVGHLSEEATEEELRALFAPYGVRSVKIMADETTRMARGFAFVEIDGDASAAVDVLNGTELHDRTLVVKVMP